jgi:hypothetical protein
MDIQMQDSPRCENSICEIDVNVHNFSVNGDATVNTIESVSYDSKNKIWTGTEKVLFENLGFVTKYNDPIKFKLKFNLNPNGSIGNLLIPSLDSELKFDSSRLSLGFDQRKLSAIERQNAGGIEKFGNSLVAGGLLKEVLAREIEDKRKMLIAKLAVKLKDIPIAINQAVRIPSFFSSKSQDITDRNKLKDDIEEIDACLNNDRLPNDNCRYSLDQYKSLKNQKSSQLQKLEDKISASWVDRNLNIAVNRVDAVNNSGGQSSQIVAEAIEDDPECLNHPMFNSEITNSAPNTDVRAEVTLDAMNYYLREVHKINVRCQRGQDKDCDQESAIEDYPLKSPPVISYNSQTGKYVLNAIVSQYGADFIAKAEVKPRFCDARQRSSRICFDAGNYSAESTGSLSAVGGTLVNVAKKIESAIAPMIAKTNRSGITIPNIRPLKISTNKKEI